MNKWVPLSFYNHSAIIYCVFAKMRKSGIVLFRVKRMSGLFHCAYEMPKLDIQKQWEYIIAN